MSDPKTDLPERRIKNYWAAIIAVAGLIIGIILIVRGDPTTYTTQVSNTEPLRGIVIIVISFVIAAIFYALNNRHYIKGKSDDNEPKEFDN